MLHHPSTKIVGAGPTGSLLAIALARAGSNITIVDPKSEVELINKSRAYAINHSSKQLLETLQIWEEIESYACPFKKLFLSDQYLNKSVLYTSHDVNSINCQENNIGWTIEHHNLMRVLLEKIESTSKITQYFGVPYEPRSERFDFFIAADGLNSKTRTELGINTFRFAYKQGCVTAKVVIRGTCSDIAYEIFRPEGPMAILPMGEQVFQVVWSAPISLCKERCSLKPSIFLDKLAAVLPENLEPDLLLDKPTTFPVSLLLSKKLYKGRTILVGETAHACHPVGGQGLNLCWRDVNELMNLFYKVHHNIIKYSLLQKTYSNNRRTDIISILLLTDMLVKMFSNKNIMLVYLRNYLLTILEKSKLIRKLTLHSMAFGPMTILRRHRRF